MSFLTEFNYMRASSPRFRLVALTVGLALSALPEVTFPQGSIFGAVRNADLTNPSAPELSWVGFLDHTDEEIRIESSTGAGYDGLHWFDDFQNYTTEVAGRPYDYFFTNPALGQADHLTNPIPANSFQQEDILLSPFVFPARPVGLAAQVLSASQIQLSWTAQAGQTYHVYRRVTSNNSVFRRLDDPTGSLNSHGVADASFTDTTSDGTSEYTYLVMAEDQTGNYSPHSDPISLVASGSPCSCPCHGDPLCDGSRDVLDLALVTDIIFSGAKDTVDATCPHVGRSDVNCDCARDVLDLVFLIDHLFNGGPQPCDPCQPGKGCR